MTATRSPWAGTSELVRFNLRLLRTRMLIWVLAIGVGVAASVVAVREAYPTQEALEGRAMLLRNPGAIMMTGPAFALDNYTFGAMVANELVLYVLIPAGIMGVLFMVGLTRGEEEAGRLELLRSRPVGRHAPAVAATLVVAIAAVLVGLAIFLAAIATDMPAADSAAFGLGTTLTTLVFAGVAAVCSQITEYARAASGTALGFMAVAFLVRGIGDVIDDQGSWVSWLSPFAWVQQTKLYVDLRWWPLGVSAAVAIALFTAAVALAQRRDLGAGLRAPKAGPARATNWVLYPAGLAERMLRVSVVAWLVGTFLFAVAMGSIADSIQDALLEIPVMEDILGSSEDLVRAFAGLVLQVLLIIPAALAATSVLRLRGEEIEGRAEQVLASGVSRLGLLLGWVATVAVQIVVCTVAVGLGLGVGVAVVTGDGGWVADLVVNSLWYLVPMAVFIALAVALYGLAPAAQSLIWVLVIWTAVVTYFGGLLNLPDWAMSLSPFHPMPLPGEAPEGWPLVAWAVVAVALFMLGLAGFSRRDLKSS